MYEPTVVVIDREVRETSRAAEPSIGADTAEQYHRACYLEHNGPIAG